MVFNFNIDDFLKKFDDNYDFLYDASRNGSEVEDSEKLQTHLMIF